MSASLQKKWEKIREPILNAIKIHLLKRYPDHILTQYETRIEQLVAKYARKLPPHVAGNEREDLKTIAQIEFLETLKIWNPIRSAEVWPLAYSRINGAMRDHIRYITKSDPSRFYDWVTDAAYLYMTVNKRADFVNQIENGLQLKQAMEALTLREKKIVNAYSKEDLTFQQISERIGISESQISRIYKKALGKIKKEIERGDPQLKSPN